MWQPPTLTRRRRCTVTVSASVKRVGKHTVILGFAVSDTGIGVRPEARERLFEAFVQGDGTTTRRFGGTGLGLSISRRLVQLMRGHIWLGDHKGPGSTFCFTARFEQSAPQTALAEIPHARETSSAAPGCAEVRPRILLVEDSSLIRRVAAAQLAELQYDVDMVENGKLAIEAVATGDYPLVLMDMRMPVMDGITATRAIRMAERKNGGHAIIVALTANILESDRSACIEAGMDDFLGKPLQLTELRKTLERWLLVAA